MTLPLSSEIQKAIFELFKGVKEGYPEELLSALVPIDLDIQSGDKSITYVPDWEMHEICVFVNDFKSILDGLQNNQTLKTRIEIMIYCHIMEADFPFAVLWNLLRILNQQQCEWTFSRVTKKGEVSTCKYTKDKIQEIQKLSGPKDLRIGELLGQLWRSDLRNAFSHSQYSLDKNFLIGTRQLSPISRNANMSPYETVRYSHEKINGLYQGAYDFLFAFLKFYNSYVEPYKNGEVYRIQVGSIKWWKERRTWIWSYREPWANQQHRSVMQITWERTRRPLLTGEKFLRCIGP